MANKLRVCLNLFFMYMEHKSLLPRFAEARKSGFKAVVIPLLAHDYPVEELKKSKEDAGIEVLMISTPTNNSGKDGYAGAAILSREEEFRANIQKTVEYAHALKCKYIRIEAGVVKSPTLEHDKLFVKNLHYVVSVCEKEDLIALILPISQYAIPNYYLNNYKKAMGVIEEIDSPRLQLVIDVFHLQSIHGDLTHNIVCFLPRTAMVQVAQVPHRHEPDIIGELDFRYVFKLLKECNFSGWIVLHQNPAKDSDEGLEFLRNGTYKELETLPPHNTS